MITANNVQPEIAAYSLAVVLVFLLLGRYGRQAMEWILMKLYEFFILGSPAI